MLNIFDKSTSRNNYSCNSRKIFGGNNRIFLPVAFLCQFVKRTMQRLSVYLLCIFATCGFVQVNGQLYRNVSRLMDQLLDGYDKRLRPVINQSHTVKVNVSFEFNTLQVRAIYSYTIYDTNMLIVLMFDVKGFIYIYN